MRILIWCPHVNLGGGKRLLHRLTMALAQHPEINLIRLALPRDAVAGMAADKIELVPLSPAQAGGWMEKERWRTDANPLRQLRSRARYLRYQMTAPGLFHSLEHDMDVVYVFWPHGVPYFPFTKPVVCTYQDATLLDFPEILGGRGTTLEYQRSAAWLQHARAVVVSSQHTAQRLRLHFPNLHLQPHLVYHNILLDETLAYAPETPLAARFAALPERYFLYPANINVHKNHEHVLIAWSRLAQREAYPLVLVGEGVEVMSASHPLHANRYWRQDALQGLVKRIGLRTDRDFFAYGYVTDAELNTIQQRATAVIMPSLSEGGGSYPVEEALALGIPVLCADIPVMRETLANRSAPVLWFDPLSPEAIVQQVNTLIANEAHYRAAASAARTDPRPTWADVASQYTHVFKTVIG